MKREQRRRLEGNCDGSDASWIEEQRPEAAQHPVAWRQSRRAPAATPQDEQLLLEQ